MLRVKDLGKDLIVGGYDMKHHPFISFVIEFNKKKTKKLKW